MEISKNPWPNGPWSSAELKEYLFYCCPECDVKVKEEDKFLQHAVKAHSKDTNLPACDEFKIDIFENEIKSEIDPLDPLDPSDQTTKLSGVLNIR